MKRNDVAIELESMGRPREHDETTRAALLSAAENLLMEGGPDALSVRRAAEAVGASTRAVYSLFGNKQGLIGALYRTAFDMLRARLAGLPVTDDPAADLVRAGVEGFRQHALAHPHLFRLTFEWEGRLTQMSESEHAVARAAFDELVGLVMRCVEAGAVEGSPRAVALGFHALCQGLASGELFGSPVARAEFPALWQKALAAYVRGFTPASRLSAVGEVSDRGRQQSQRRARPAPGSSRRR
jgi:AcrR family transcriptional regulator